jgi:hypothetical protein
MLDPEFIPGVRAITDAIRIMARHHELSSEAEIRYWKPNQCLGEGSPTGIFAYYFFDVRGRYCGLYMPDRGSVQLQVTPVNWGRPKRHKCLINSDRTIQSVH